jgi:branched-chain amino acid transport system permease protein
LRYWGVRLVSVILAVVGCMALQRFAATQDSFAQRLIVLAGLYVTLSVSLNLINGITGQFSIGHAAFYMVGAYTTGFLATNFYQRYDLPGPVWLLLMMLASAAAAAVAGLIVGLPSLRLKGDYLAIVTLGFGEILRIVAQNQPKLGGAYGMAVTPRFQYVWIVWLLAILCMAVCRNLLKTAHGLPFLAVREDEVASSAMGVNVTRVKVTAFLLGSMFAGAAGALLAHFEGFVSPAMFTMDVSFIILTMVVLGGTGSITGSALAAVVLFYLPEKMRDLGDVKMGMLVAVAIGIVLFIYTMRKLMFDFHGPKLTRFFIGVGIVAVTLVFIAIAGGVLGNVQGLTTSVEGSKLRLVVFAVTLVALMLLRPQGIFGHHEFSWSWVKRIFTGKPVPNTAVSS